MKMHKILSKHNLLKFTFWLSFHGNLANSNTVYCLVIVKVLLDSSRTKTHSCSRNNTKALLRHTWQINHIKQLSNPPIHREYDDLLGPVRNFLKLDSNLVRPIRQFSSWKVCNAFQRAQFTSKKYDKTSKFSQMVNGSRGNTLNFEANLTFTNQLGHAKASWQSMHDL